MQAHTNTTVDQRALAPLWTLRRDNTCHNLLYIIYKYLSTFINILYYTVTSTHHKYTKQNNTHHTHKTLSPIWSKSCPYFAHFMYHVLPIFCHDSSMVQFFPFYDQFMVHILPIICTTIYVSHIWTKIGPIYGPKFAQILPNLFCGKNRSKLWSRFCPCFGTIFPIV